MRTSTSDILALPLEAPSARTYVAMAALMLVLPLGLEIAVSPVGRSLSFAGPTPRVLGVAIMLAFTGAVYGALVLLMRRHRVRLDAGGLEVATTFYRRRLDWADLRLEAARVVSIDERPELKPALKSNGFAVPGSRSGWFRSRRLGRLFVATAGGKTLLWLPTTLGYDVLLQPQQPAVLLDAIKARADAATPAMAPGRAGR